MIPESTETYASLAAIRSRHRELLAIARDSESREADRQIRAFLEAAARAGAVIESRSDRSAAQALLGYWVGYLYTTLAADEVPEAILDPFDAVAVPDLADRTSPYMGLAAFRQAEAALFFGRRDAKEKLIEAFRRHPILLVTGPSGSGKSSLVRAGLLATLETDPERQSWQVLPVVIPGADPIGALVRALGSPEGEDLTLAMVRRATFSADPRAFVQLLAAGLAGRPIVLVVDQLEELFSLCQDHLARERFAEALVALAHAADGNRVVLTIREDYLKAILGLKAFAPLAENPDLRFAPPPLSASELREVVVRPAEMVGLKFDEGIVDELIREVRGEPTALPLLQFALQRLWESRERNRITWDVYRKVGTPGDALQRKADELYGHLPQVLDRDVARLIFLDLVQPAVGIEFVRRRVSREMLHRHASTVVVDQVLDRFVAAGLLLQTPGTTSDDDRFEVAHEALIRNWPLLSGWLMAVREQLQERARLRAAAELSRNSGWDQGTLLSGSFLRKAEAYPHLDSLEKEFLLRSNRAEEELRQKETLEARRQLHRRNIALGVLGMMVILIVIISVVSYRKVENALREERAARNAERKALANEKAASTTLTDYKQDVAKLLRNPTALTRLSTAETQSFENLDSLIALIETAERPALVVCDRRVTATLSPYWSERLAGAEEIIGRTLRSVGRIDQRTESGFKQQATGFVVGPDLIFVFGPNISDPVAGSEYWISFDEESCSTAGPAAADPARFRLSELLHTFKEPSASFALYRVEGLGPDHPALELALDPPEPLTGRTVFTVGHPASALQYLPREISDLILGEGGPGVKRLSPGFIVTATPNNLAHDCTTMGGSGGGPLVDVSTGKVIGIHYSKDIPGDISRQKNLARPLWFFPALKDVLDQTKDPPAP